MITEDEFVVNSGEEITKEPLDVDSDWIDIVSKVTEPSHGKLIINEFVGSRWWQDSDSYTYTANDDAPDGTVDSFSLLVKDGNTSGYRGATKTIEFTVTITSPPPEEDMTGGETPPDML